MYSNGEDITIKTIDELRGQITGGYIADDTEITDGHNSKIQAIDVRDYRVVKFDIWIDGKMEFFQYYIGGIGLVACIIVYLSYTFTSYAFMWVCAIIGAAIAAVVAAKITGEARDKAGPGISSKKEYVLYGVAILTTTLFPIGVIPGINCLLDISSSISRHTIIRGFKIEDERGPHGMRLGAKHFVMVDSWWPDIKLIKVPDNGDETIDNQGGNSGGRRSVGDSIMVNCRSGLLGIEYFDSGKSKKEKEQSDSAAQEELDKAIMEKNIEINKLTGKLLEDQEYLKTPRAVRIRQDYTKEYIELKKMGYDDKTAADGAMKMVQIMSETEGRINEIYIPVHRGWVEEIKKLREEVKCLEATRNKLR